MGDVRASIENAVVYLTEHPDEARYTDSVATARLESGLRFSVTGAAGESLVTDMPPSVGGGGEGPSPGWVLRAALASCVGTLVAIEAARDGAVLSRLEVEVDSESDDRGILGIDETVPAGPLSMRVRVAAEAEDGRDLGAVVERAVARCPVTDAVRRAVPLAVEGGV
jgi:uncharacterized OsmC-like protein